MMQSHKSKSLISGSQPTGQLQLNMRGRTVQDQRINDRIPEVPHLPDGYQHGRTKPTLGGALHSHPVRLDNEEHKAEKGDPNPRLTQFLSRTKLVSTSVNGISLMVNMTAAKRVR